MGFDLISLLAVILLGITSITILVSTDWRLSTLALAIQYVGVTLLVTSEWPFVMAIIKLITGWIAAAVLGMALINLSKLKSDTPPNMSEPERNHIRSENVLIPLPMGVYFPIIAALLVLLTVFTVAPQVVQWLADIRIEVAWGALILISMGLLRLGFTNYPFPTILGLLTILAGFEILYAGVETSALLAGLLAAVNLGLALTGAYFLTSATIEEPS